jgi:hypothetical protein
VATTSSAASVLLLLLPLLLIATLAARNSFVEGAFHDGITGSSLRFNTRWSKADHKEKQSRNLQSFTGSSSAKESCEAAKAKEESDIAPGEGSAACICEQSILDERYSDFLDPNDQPIVFELTCIDTRCSYCSSDGTTCDRFSYGAIFEEVKVQEGITIRDAVVQVGYFETNQYIVGRPEAVVYTEYTDPNAPGAHACSMEIDGLRCAVCEYVNCIGDTTARANDIDVYFGLNIVCSNILIGDGDGGYIAASDFETCDHEQIAAIGSSQGVFEMYDPDYGQCFTSTEGCDRDKIELEQDGYYDCECLDENLSTQGVSPYLENLQLKCEKTAGGSNSNSNSDSDSDEICEALQKDSIERVYSSYVPETTTRSIQLENGSILTIEEFDCLTTRGFSDGCSQCKASIDGVECSSCEMGECASGSDGEGMLAPQISCGNASDELEDSKAVDLCRAKTASGTPFEAFAECGFGEPNKIPMVMPPTDAPVGEAPPPLSLMACREKQNEFLQRTNNFIDSEVLDCECYLINEDAGIDAGTLFECTTNGGVCGTNKGGSICNANYSEEDENENENGTCFREELVQGFLPDGNTTPMTRTTTYTHGTALGNSLVGRTLVLTEYGNESEGCQLLVDGQACASCQLKNCGDDIGIRPLVDCSNVIDDPSFQLDTCDAFPPYDDGLLLRLTTGTSGSDGTHPTNDFQICISEESEENSFPVDPSLPVNCEKAQPIVLPTQQDDTTTNSDMTNPNINFAFVSFVSSTKGLTLAKDEFAAVQTACEGEEGDSSDSPGLWYSLVGNGKGVRASVCREATNFEARISVYEGSCDSISCAASTPLTDTDFRSSCDVHWIAEVGSTYYVRVHGSDSSQTGTFNLFLETLEEETTTTCYSDETSEFDQACLSCSKTRAARIQEFSNNPADIDCRCIEKEGTGGYHLTCVDMSCLKCNPRQDVCGFDTFELDIQRTGDSPSGSYDSFYFMNKKEGVQVNEIVALQGSECLEILDPHNQCMMAREELMEEADTPIFCECRGVSEEGDYMLLCSIYDTYDYCASDESSSNSESDVCASVLFGQSISQYGSVTSEFRSYRIMKDDEIDEVESSILIERFADSCFVSINEEACSKCEVSKTCVNNRREDDVLNIAAFPDPVFTDISVDCSNLMEEEGATATFECGSIDGSSNNLLSILVGSVSSSTVDAIADKNPQQTIPPDAFPPTMAPVTKPTPQPIEPIANGNSNSNTTPTPNSTDSNNATDDKEGVEDSSARGLAERRTFAYAASTMALASIFLLL